MTLFLKLFKPYGQHEEQEAFSLGRKNNNRRNRAVELYEHFVGVANSESLNEESVVKAYLYSVPVNLGGDLIVRGTERGDAGNFDGVVVENASYGALEPVGDEK